MFDAYYIHEKCSMVYTCTFYLYISLTELLFCFLVATVVNVNHPTISESKWLSLASTSV